MKQSERNELVRIVKARFKLLRDQAVMRSYEIFMQEEEEAKHEAYARAAQFRDEYDRILEEMKPFLVQINVLVEKIRRDDIVQVNGRYGGPALEIEVPKRYGRGGAWNEKLSMIDKHVITELDLAELAMIEEILMGGFETEEARKMLERIPTVDQLVKGEVKLAEIAPSKT